MRVWPREIRFSLTVLTEGACECVKLERAGNSTRGMVRLIGRSPERHVERVANDLCHATVTGKYNVRHSGYVLHDAVILSSTI